MDISNSDKMEEPIEINSRNRPQKISNEDKNKIINAYENNENLVDVTRILGIRNINTVYNIIYRYNKSGLISLGKIGGHRPKLINEETGELLLEFVNSKYNATLGEMKSYLESLGLIVSKTTISKFLKDQFYTFKKVRNLPERRNTDEAKMKRFHYVQRLLDEGWRSSQCVYIDETAIDIWMHSIHGRSKRGQPLNVTVCNTAGPSLSLIMAINKDGFVHHKSLLGSINHEVYQDFVRELSLRLPDKKLYLIHDNAAIHNSTLTTSSNHEIVNLPPYSPFLNPIETCFSQLKSVVRKKLSSSEGIVKMSINQRLDVLKRIVAEIVNDDKFQNLRPHYHHTKTYYSKCLLQLDIL